MEADHILVRLGKVVGKTIRSEESHGHSNDGSECLEVGSSSTSLDTTLKRFITTRKMVCLPNQCIQMFSSAQSDERRSEKMSGSRLAMLWLA